MYVVSFTFHAFNVLALVSKEDHSDHSCRIKCSYYCSKNSYCKDWYCPSVARLVYSCKDCVLAPKSCCDKRSTHQGKTCSPHKRICLFHLFSQSSHVSHEPGTNNMQQGSCCHEKRCLEH